MKNQRRYRGSRRKIGLLIPVLVVLCIIAATALYVINNNMTFTKEGSFFIPEKDETPQDVEANLVIEEPEVEIEELVSDENGDNASQETETDNTEE